MIFKQIHEYALKHPQKTAIIINGQKINYINFANYIFLYRKFWAEKNFTPGSLAIVVCNNRMIGWCAILALQSLGLVTISAEKISVLKDLDLRKISCILMLNATEEELQDSLSYWPGAVGLQLPSVRDIVNIPKSIEYKSGGGHILYTSGTTGTYKKIFHDAALDQLKSKARENISGTNEESIINVTFYGPWTAIGHRVPFFTWTCGGTVVFDNRKDWPLYLGDHGVTQVSMTTGALIKATDALSQEVPKLATRWNFELVVGGGVTSASLIRSVHELITPNLIVSFGCTEMFLPVMRTKAEENNEDFWLNPIEIRNVDIVDEEGNSCADLVEGILRIRLQETDYSRYMNDPDTTSKVFRDGWFYPGDMAMRRSDGRIRVLGRTADVINVRGNKRPSAVLEEGIREVLSVNAVCAFSGLMNDNEDRIVIVVETFTSIPKSTYQQLVTQLKKVIGDVHFVEMKKFPLTRSGTLKVDRVALRKLVMNLAHSQR